MLYASHICGGSLTNGNNMYLENIPSIRSLMLHRPEFNNLMLVKAEASSAARCKAVCYTPPARNLLGRLRVVFRGFRGQRKRATDRWNTMVSLIATTSKGAAERPAVQRAETIAFCKYWATLHISGREERRAMLGGLTQEAVILTLDKVVRLKLEEEMPDVTNALAARLTMMFAATAP